MASHVNKTPTPPDVGKKRERTRAALIEAALAVAEEKGFVAANLDEIAARAGMTKGAIYSNFGGKTDLMLAAAQSRSAAFAPAYTPGASLDVHMGQVAQAIVQMLPSIQKAARLQADFQVFLLQEPELRAKLAREMTAGLHALIGLVAEHHREELRISPEQFVMAAQALSLGFAHQSMQTPGLVTEGTVLAAFEALTAGAKQSMPPPSSGS